MPAISWYTSVESDFTVGTSLPVTALVAWTWPVRTFVSRTSPSVIGLMITVSRYGSLSPFAALPHQSGFFLNA